MDKKSERTIEKYMEVGAMMRLCKTLASGLIVKSDSILSATDRAKLYRAAKVLQDVSSLADRNMFTDFPQLSNEYCSVFYGATDVLPRNDVDKKVLEISKKAANDLFLMED